MNAKPESANDAIKSKLNTGEDDKDVIHNGNGFSQADKNIHSNLTLMRWLDQSFKEGPFHAIHECNSGTGENITNQNEVADDNSFSLKYLALEAEVNALEQGEEFVV
jgi:hypothetical protein